MLEVSPNKSTVSTPKFIAKPPVSVATQSVQTISIKKVDFGAQCKMMNSPSKTSIKTNMTILPVL